MQTFSGRKASQNPEELAHFIGFLQSQGVKRYLEIGARHGDTFHAVMTSLDRPSVGVAVDWPGAAWGITSSEAALQKAVSDLLHRAIPAQVIIGNSTGPNVLAKVRRYGQFDAVLIDGDHRYEGARADWINYREMARIVAFHDIAGVGEHSKDGQNMPVEVPRLWSEIKWSGQHKTLEFIAPGSTMGIGVVCP